MTLGRRADVWGVPALLGIAMLANAGMVPLVPFTLATRLGWPLWLVGGYSFAVMAVTMMITHRLSVAVDTVRRKSLLCLVCAASQVVGAVAAIGALNGVLWLLPLTIVGTAVGGAVAPVYYTLGRLIAHSEERDPAAVNSLLRVITSAAWVVGPAVAFAIFGTSGLAPTFAAIATVSAAGGLAVLLSAAWLDRVAATSTTDSPADAQESSVPAEIEGSSVRRHLMPHGTAFVVVVLFSLAHISTTTSLPLLLVREFDVPESATGLFLGLKAAVEMIAILATPLLAKWFSSAAVLTIAGLGALIAYGSYLFGSGLGWALFAAVCEGAYYGLFAVTALTWMQSIAGLQLGRSTGSYMNAIYAGVLVGAPLSGLVASVDLGWIAGLSLLAALLALGALRWGEKGTPSRSGGEHPEAT